MILPPVPLISGPRTLTLAELGIATEEFSGRRFRREFFVGLPGDFYLRRLSARRRSTSTRAYTAEVRAGSRIDVYVNGFIAANQPLTSDDGDILQHLPIKVSMTHFRPGVNTIAIEAVLDTEADAICAPGTVAGGPNRFVLFDTSEFAMPAFARVERWPDLSALAGAGLPYARDRGPGAGRARPGDGRHLWRGPDVPVGGRDQCRPRHPGRDGAQRCRQHASPPSSSAPSTSSRRPRSPTSASPTRPAPTGTSRCATRTR